MLCRFSKAAVADPPTQGPRFPYSQVFTGHSTRHVLSLVHVNQASISSTEWLVSPTAALPLLSQWTNIAWQAGVVVHGIHFVF